MKNRNKKIFAVLICLMLGVCGCSSSSVADSSVSSKETSRSPAEESISLNAEDVPDKAEGGAEADSQGSDDSQAVNAPSEPDAAALMAASNVKDLFKSHGKLSVKGTNLVDKKGKPFQLRGISTHGLSWFPQYVNKEGFKTLRDEWGCNVVRLAMYTAEGNGYCTGDKANRKYLRKLVEDGVGYATELDMYVIVDWHILSDGNPNTYKKQAKAYFKYMSKKFKNNDHVIYEICNEPNGGTTWEEVKSYAKSIIKTIRKNDKDAVIIVGSPTWSQDVDIAANNPLKGKNIMYSLHFYASTHKENLRQKAQTAMDKGLPLFVTEFGFCDASGNGSIDKQESEKWIEYLNDNNISYCMWSLCNKAESASALNPDCNSTSNWKSSDLSTAGKMLVKFLNGRAAGGKGSSNSGNGSNSGSSGKDSSNGGTGSNSGSGSKDSNKNENIGNGDSDGKNDETGNEGNGGGGKNDGSDTDASNEKATVSRGCKANVKVSNSWADSENSYFQYFAELKNGNEIEAVKWKIKITFTHAFDLQQGWGGVYHRNGKTLTITPEGYNSKVKMDASVSDIGFIIKSSAGNKIEKLELVLK